MVASFHQFYGKMWVRYLFMGIIVITVNFFVDVQIETVSAENLINVNSSSESSSDSSPGGTIPWRNSSPFDSSTTDSSPMDISPTGQFLDRVFPQKDSSEIRHFPDWTFPRLTVFPTRHFPDWPFPPIDISPKRNAHLIWAIKQLGFLPHLQRPLIYDKMYERNDYKYKVLTVHVKQKINIIILKRNL